MKKKIFLLFIVCLIGAISWNYYKGNLMENRQPYSDGLVEEKLLSKHLQSTPFSFGKKIKLCKIDWKCGIIRKIYSSFLAYENLNLDQTRELLLNIVNDIQSQVNRNPEVLSIFNHSDYRPNQLESNTPVDPKRIKVVIAIYKDEEMNNDPGAIHYVIFDNGLIMYQTYDPNDKYSSAVLKVETYEEALECFSKTKQTL